MLLKVGWQVGYLLGEIVGCTNRWCQRDSENVIQNLCRSFEICYKRMMQTDRVNHLKYLKDDHIVQDKVFLAETTEIKLVFLYLCI